MADKVPVGLTGETPVLRLPILVCFGSTCGQSLAVLYSAAGACMPTETGPHLELDIAHVLFVDVVGYSKLLIDEQRALLDELNHVIRSIAEFRKAQAQEGQPEAI